MILVEDVHKRYQTDRGPGKWVLQGVSFVIPPKLNVGLVGGNGAGKSTLLRLIGGGDMPSRGRIERNCRVSWPMGFGGGLQGSLTGRQNAKFVCRIHGHEDDIPDRLSCIQEFAELGEAFDEPIKTYSSGMKSRLQFGLSLAFDFDVYISDEVTATGDAAFRKKAADAFRNIADHASVIMVSHGEGTLKQFCTAGIWLNQGKAHWFDDINDALTAYKDSQKTVVAMDGGVSGKGSPELKTDRPLAPKPALTPPCQGEDSTCSSPDKVGGVGFPLNGQSGLNHPGKQRKVLDILEKGRGGMPELVDHEEGRRIVRIARKAGVELATREQIAWRGYRLKPGMMPILKKYFPSSDEKHEEFYDLLAQCVKAEITE